MEFFDDLLRCLCSFLDPISCIPSSGNRISHLQRLHPEEFRLPAASGVMWITPWSHGSWSLPSHWDIWTDLDNTTQTVELWNLSSCRPAGIFILSLFHFICSTLVWDWRLLFETVLDFFFCVNYLIGWWQLCPPQVARSKERWSESSVPSCFDKDFKFFTVYLPTKGLKQLVEWNC